MQILLAVAGPNNASTRGVVKTLVDSLGVMHINMRQPIINVVADCLGVDSHQLYNHIPLHKFIPEHNQNVGQLQSMLEHFLCKANKRYLIEKAKSQIESSTILLATGIFNGHIISNITSEAEAEWARTIGAILIHVHDQYSLCAPVVIAEQPSDLLVYTGHSVPASEQNLAEIIHSISQHFQRKNAKQDA